MATVANANLQGQPVQITVLQGDELTRRRRERLSITFPPKTIFILSVIQILAFVLTLICQVAMYVTFKNNFPGRRKEILEIWAGVWLGIFYTAPGILGFFAVRKPSTCRVTALMVLNIVAVISCCFMIFYASVGIIEHANSYRWRNGYGVFVFFFAAKLLIALGEACVAITTAAFCCKTACDPCCFSGFVGTGTGSGGLEDAAVIFKPDTPVANGGRGGRDVGGQATVPIESILDASITNDRDTSISSFERDEDVDPDEFGDKYRRF